MSKLSIFSWNAIMTIFIIFLNQNVGFHKMVIITLIVLLVLYLLKIAVIFGIKIGEDKDESKEQKKTVTGNNGLQSLKIRPIKL